jgi:DNA-binding MarR family transcriptional regulator
MESLERIQLTIPQSIVLRILASLGGSATMCELVDHSFQAGPTLTRIVDRLVAAGFVTRERAAHDRRQVLIVLTPAGCAKQAAAQACAVADSVQLTSGLSDAELAQFNQYLQRLLDGMEAVRAATQAPAQVDQAQA